MKSTMTGRERWMGAAVGSLLAGTGLLVGRFLWQQSTPQSSETRPWATQPEAGAAPEPPEPSAGVDATGGCAAPAPTLPSAGVDATGGCAAPAPTLIGPLLCARGASGAKIWIREDRAPWRLLGSTGVWHAIPTPGAYWLRLGRGAMRSMAIHVRITDGEHLHLVTRDFPHALIALERP